MTTVLGIAVVLMPVAAVVALLQVTTRVARRRELARVRQVLLTDAIHRELGAVAAPVVTGRAGGEWVVAMRAPLDRPGTVAALLRITGAEFGGANGGRLRIVLTPQPAPRRAAEPARTADRRRADSLVPAVR